MNNKLWFLVSILCVSTSSYAACTKSSIVGTWKVSVDSSMPGMSPNMCELVVQRNGSFASTSNCKESLANSAGSDYSNYPVKGMLKVDSKCQVTGDLEQHNGLSTAPPTPYNVTLNAYLNVKGNDVVVGRIDGMMSSRSFYAIKIK